MKTDFSDWKSQITEYKGQDLLNRIQQLRREQVIEWLEWNDHNGVYNDEDSMGEFDRIITTKEGQLIMFCQISGLSYSGEEIDYIRQYGKEIAS